MCRAEQYTGGKLGIKITIILPPEGMASFNEQMENGNIRQIKANLTTFDVANAKASVPADEVKVKGLISSTVGFDTVNRSVAKSMQTWCASSLKAYLEGCVDLLEDDDFDSNTNMVGIKGNADQAVIQKFDNESIEMTVQTVDAYELRPSKKV